MKKSNKTTNAAPQPEIDGAFLSMVQLHRRGELLSDMSEALREVAGAVTLVGKGGFVTLKLKIDPAAKGGAMVVTDEIKVTLPKAEKSGSVFYVDGQGNLTREDPNQMKMELRVADGGKGKEEPLRQPAAAAAAAQG